jgi:hypothetical protein
MNVLEPHHKSLQIQGYGTSVSEGFYEHPSLNRAFGESRNREFQTPGNGDFSGAEIPPGNPILFFTLLSMLYPLAILRFFWLGKIWGWTGLYLHNLFIYRRLQMLNLKHYEGQWEGRNDVVNL